MNFFHKPLEIQPKTLVPTSPDETFHALHDIQARQSWLHTEGLSHPPASVYEHTTETKVSMKRLYQIERSIFPIMLEETVEEFDPEKRRFASRVERTDDAGMNFHVELEVSPDRERDGSAIEMHIEAVGVNGLLGVFARHRMERETERRLAQIGHAGTDAAYRPPEPQVA